MKIILLRHGETIWNIESRLQGCRDIPLAENGILQLGQVGKHLADLDMKIDVIASSPLQRARKSAEIVAQALHYPTEQILTEPLFVERSFGECEGMVYGDAIKKYPDGNYPGMETLEELYERACKAIAHCVEVYAGQNVMVVAHGAIIKAVLVVASKGKIGYFDQDVWIDNGSYCVMEGDGEKWRISLCNRTEDYRMRTIVD